MPDDCETLHTETWSWTLVRTPRGVLLSVVCGTVGLYERTIALTPDEMQVWQDGGPTALEPLVESVRNDVSGEALAGRYL